MPEQQVFRLPDVGEGLTEAEIVAWHVQVGDRVSINDALLDVETAKSVVELPSPFSGVVTQVHASDGETLGVGSPLITIEADAEAEAIETEPSPSSGPTADTAPDTTAAPVSAPVPAREIPGAVLATRAAPAWRHEVDLSGEPEDAPLVLVGTAPKKPGSRRVRLRRPEARAFERPRPDTVLHGFAGDSGPIDSSEIRIPVRGVRKATAEAMVRSAFSAPHATMWTTVDVTAAMGLVRRLKSDRDWTTTRVSPLLLVAKTVASAVHRYPEINASWDQESQEIVLHRALNLGIAAATPRGLMVPNLKDAGSLTLQQMAEALADVITRARAGKLAPQDMSGGTLTITNVGTFGVEGATPILNPPEAAILALGAIQPRPWVIEGRVEVRDAMTISVSIDHRVVDGELGARFLRHVAESLNDPARALL